MIKKTIILTTSLLGIAAIGLTALADNRTASIPKAKAKGKTQTSKAPSALDLFPDKLYNAKGEPISKDKLEGKIVGIYFSAHWCPPCRAFTPELVEFRDANKDEFEVVFVSADESENAQLNYMSETKMKWLAVKFGARDANKLKKRFAVRGIPSLVIVGPDGKTITKNGRGDVSRKGSAALKGWKAKAGIRS